MTKRDKKELKHPINFPQDFENCRLKTSQFKKYSENPFMEQFYKDSFINTSTHPLPMELRGKVPVDKDTGEVYDVRRIYAYADGITYNDNREFVKLYEMHMAQLSTLNPEELRILIYTFMFMTYEATVNLYPKYVSEVLNYKTDKSVLNGIRGLLQKGFIARSNRMPNEYFCNPMIYFKGHAEKYYAEYVKDRAKKMSLSIKIANEECENFENISDVEKNIDNVDDF